MQSSRDNMASAAPSLTSRTRKDNSRTRQLTPEELEEVKYAFELFDQDKKGWVRPREVKIALRALGFGVKKREVNDMISEAARADDVQQVSRDVFQQVLTFKLSSRQTMDTYKRAFELLDIKNQGFIDLKTLQTVVKHLQEQIDDAELSDMIREFDMDNDERISEQEFLSIMQSYD